MDWVGERPIQLERGVPGGECKGRRRGPRAENRIMRLSRLLRISILAAASATLLPACALADAWCSGHKLLPKPRPEASCPVIIPKVFVSPDKALRATVLPVDVSLFASPDMESRVVIRSRAGDTL